MCPFTVKRKVLLILKSKDLMPKVGSGVLVRAVALCVGQGDSTLYFIKDGARYATLLADINQSEDLGLDVPELLKAVLGSRPLDIFLNTHPHADHLCGIKELDAKVGFKSVMHADYDPGKHANDGWDEFKKIVERKQKANPSSVIEIDGSYKSQKLFDAQLHVLAPAEYVLDDTEEKSREVRRELIHENCVVFKIGKNAAWVLQPGDADYKAFKNHIFTAHKKDLGAKVLLASHHGSKYFFWDDGKCEDEEAWTDHLCAIDPNSVIISAPRRHESRFDHPDPEAVKLYEEQVGSGEVYHTGAKRHSFIVDIFEDGQIGKVTSDEGGLMDEFQLGKEKPFRTPTFPAGDRKPRQFG